MSRVAWSKYPGDDIEQAIAMFLAAEHPKAVRIRPSRGDGGIDILDKDERTVVYQVKGFHQTFSNDHWRKIEDSIDRLVTDPRWAALTVDEWHLVVPVDPTPEAFERLRKYATERGLPEPHWDGLERCEVWAADHPRTVDYFFNGSREDILKAAALLMHIQGKDSDSLSVPTVKGTTADLEATVKYLNEQDPFYSYGIHVQPAVFGDERDIDRLVAQAESQRTRPDLVTRVVTADRHTTVAVDVFAKTPLSTDLRPIKAKLQMTAKVGSAEHTAIEDWAKYGTPFELPLGSVAGEIDGPEGIGGLLVAAGLRVFPSHGSASPQHEEVRLLLFDQGGAHVQTLTLRQQYLTGGTPGLRPSPGVERKYSDKTGCLSLVLRWDDNSDTAMSVQMDCPQGQLAVDAQELTAVMLGLRTPGNTFTLAPKFGPLPGDRHPVPASSTEDLDVVRHWAALSQALSQLQEHSTAPLHFPTEENPFAPELLRHVFATDALLNGNTAPFECSFVLIERDANPLGSEGTVVAWQEWSVELPEGKVEVGPVATVFEGRLVEVDVPHNGQTWARWEVINGTAELRMAAPEETTSIARVPENDHGDEPHTPED